MKQRVCIPLFFAVAIIITMSGQGFSQEPRVAILAKSKELSPPIRSPQQFDYEGELIPVWQWPLRHSGTGYLRIHFRVKKNAPDDVNWWFILRDVKDEEKARYDREYVRSKESSFWSDEIPGDYVTIELYADKDPTGLEFVIDKYLYQVTPVDPESFIGGGNLEDMFNLKESTAEGDKKIYSWGKAVAKVSYIDNDKGKGCGCTGFLISNTLIMTNYHCVDSQAICNNTEVKFGYEIKDDPSAITYHCIKYETGDSLRDYAILRLDGNPGQTWSKLDLASKDVSENDPLYIIQHPAGSWKRISRIDCKVAGINIPAISFEDDLCRNPISSSPINFGHLCDTTKGSSGSPVLDATGSVVGLDYHGACPGEPRMNRSILTKHILSHLRDNRPDLYHEVMNSDP
jgi:hypothetical protein